MKLYRYFDIEHDRQHDGKDDEEAIDRREHTSKSCNKTLRCTPHIVQIRRFVIIVAADDI